MVPDALQTNVRAWGAKIHTPARGAVAGNDSSDVRAVAIRIHQVNWILAKNSCRTAGPGLRRSGRGKVGMLLVNTGVSHRNRHVLAGQAEPVVRDGHHGIWRNANRDTRQIIGRSAAIYRLHELNHRRLHQGCPIHRRQHMQHRPKR